MNTIDLNSSYSILSRMVLRIKIPSAVCLLFLLASPLSANYEYFESVQRAAKAYRVEVSVDAMKLVPDEKGGETFHITLKSNRNNFEMVMLVGYIAAGEAMKTGVKPSQIHVSVDVPLGEGYRLVTMAEKQDVEKLIGGELNTAQFARLIKYI